VLRLSAIAAQIARTAYSNALATASTAWARNLHSARADALRPLRSSSSLEDPAIATQLPRSAPKLGEK
jgi:hypothetical protein